MPLDEQHLRQVRLAALDSMLEPLSILDPVRDATGRIVDFSWMYVNGAARVATADPDPDSLIGDRIGRRMPQLAHLLMAGLVEVIETGRPCEVERLPAGPRTYAMRCVYVEGHVAISWKDVTDQVAAETELAASAERFRTAMAAAPGGMAVVGMDRRFVEVNEALAAMVGHDRLWLLQHTVPDVLHPAEDEHDRLVRERIVAGELDNVTRECRFRRADGSDVWVLHAIGLMRDRNWDPMGFVSQMIDITQARAAREELQYQATHDPMTRLANRRALVSTMERILRHPPRAGRQPGVLFLDVDGLKRVNDELGHSAGDELIVQIADRVRRSVRDEDQVARLGGDEFVVLLPSVSGLDDVLAIGDKIRRSIAHEVRLPQGDVQVTASAGATLAVMGEDPDAVIRRADQALYRAKSSGRDQVTALHP